VWARLHACLVCDAARDTAALHTVCASAEHNCQRGRQRAQVVDLAGVALEVARVLEKPDDEAHALQMLQALSGTTHAVHTGARPRGCAAPRALTSCGRACGAVCLQRLRWSTCCDLARDFTPTGLGQRSLQADYLALLCAQNAHVHRRRGCFRLKLKCPKLEAVIDTADDSFKHVLLAAGVVLMFPKLEAPVIESFNVTTLVTFGILSEDEIKAYIATGEPFGKAGAYGIQGPAGAWVSKIDGCASCYLVDIDCFIAMSLCCRSYARCADCACNTFEHQADLLPDRDCLLTHLKGVLVLCRCFFNVMGLPLQALAYRINMAISRQDIVL
jgi:predicted house-cleaning NTP pyrophosphatase (Maf/HAM1 superfamily)